MTKINFKTPRIDENTSAWSNTQDELYIHALDADNDKWKIVLIFGRGIVSDRFCNLAYADENTAKKEVIAKLRTEENGKSLLITLTEQALEDQEVQKSLQSNDRRGFYVPRVLRDYR